jgi:hypothetical protein
VQCGGSSLLHADSQKVGKSRVAARITHEAKG